MPATRADAAASACTNRRFIEQTDLRLVVSRRDRSHPHAERNSRRGYGRCDAIARFLATSAVNEVCGSRRNEVVNANSRANNMRDQSRRVLRDVKGLGSIAAENVGEAAHRLKERGRGALAAGRQGLRKAERQLLDIVEEHPFKSLLVAIGVGALLGLTMRRRQS
jgi:ElaB/YqjD/DUF883 family membrane-anchored ribosome-binding protein